MINEATMVPTCVATLAVLWRVVIFVLRTLLLLFLTYNTQGLVS